MFGLAASRSDAAPPKYKTIFEPVNYTEDLELTDVHFVSADVGWVTGAAGTILHTTDGGRHWTSREISFPASVVTFSLPQPVMIQPK